MISDAVRQQVANTMEVARREGVTAWTFMIKDDNVQVVSNLGRDGNCNEMAAIVENTEFALELMRDVLTAQAQQA